MNRVQFEIDLMNEWLDHYGDSPQPARFMLLGRYEDPEIHEFLKLRNPSTRQVINAMTRRMECWHGRYVNNDYVWQYLGLLPFDNEGSLRMFRCVKG